MELTMQLSLVCARSFNMARFMTVDFMVYIL